jgi:hypothetical protein
MATTETIHALQVAGWYVTGPYRCDSDSHPSFRIAAPGRIVASVYCVDGDYARSEDEAIAMAFAALRSLT